MLRACGDPRREWGEVDLLVCTCKTRIRRRTPPRRITVCAAIAAHQILNAPSNESHSIASHCIALHCIAWHPIALHRIASHRIASHPIASHPIPSHCIALHCIALHCIALHCIASHRIASHRIASHRIASHRIVSCRVVSCRIAKEESVASPKKEHHVKSHCSPIAVYSHFRPCGLIDSLFHCGSLCNI